MKAQADDIGAGSSTARVSAADAEARQLRQRSARGNLAARVFEEAGLPLDGSDDPRDPVVRAAAAEIIKLADILGLTQQPVRAPGHCSCGEVLPMSSATSSPTCRPGFCAKCTAAYRPPEVRVMTGECAVCRREYGLTNSGRVRSHQGWDRHVRLAVLCKGSQQPPVEAP